MIEYDKRLIIEKLVSQLEQKTQIIAKAAENARQDSIVAEGRMQTRYGSEKEESGYLADGLMMRRNSVEQGIGVLSKLQLPENPERVTSGTLVRVREGSDLSYYFVLPYGGGETLEINGGEITILSPVSPIAKAMVNKRRGENFPFGRMQYTIDDLK